MLKRVDMQDGIAKRIKRYDNGLHRVVPVDHMNSMGCQLDCNEKPGVECVRQVIVYATSLCRARS
jgi:hypothetical protein